ncbi:armadillo-type protein [Powellomyces hirtus]|nr:armadillo-type protein [Powellomyces hirtus]
MQASLSPSPPTFHSLVDLLPTNTDSLNCDPSTKTLRALRSLPYPLKRCPAENVRALISYGRQNCTHGPDVSLFIDILFQLFSKQKIQYTSHEEQLEIIGQCVEYLLSIINASLAPTSPDDPCLDALRALGTVVYENGAVCAKYHSELLAVLIPMQAVDGRDERQMVARRMSLTCLANICVKTGAKGANLQKEVLDILMRNLTGDLSDEGNSKVVSSALRGIQLLINENKAIAQEVVTALVPILQRIALHTPAATPSAVAVIKQPARRSMAIPSDSELSDGEPGLPRNRQRDNRLQLNALLCLQSLAKAQAKLLFPYWFRFLPDPVEGPSSPSLISVMRDSDSPKVRHGACAALMAFLDGSKQYLSVAEDSSTTRQPTSFTSLSAKLAEQLREIHEGLITAVKEETWPLLLAQELRCLTVLVKNCTYDRLQPSYRQNAFQIALDRITPEDYGITSAAFECLSAILDSKMPISPNTNPDGSNAFLSPLVDLAYAQIQKTEHISVRVAGLEVFCALARNEVTLFGAVWQRLVPVLAESILDPKEAVRAASYKLLEQYAHSCCSVTEGIQVQTMDWWCELVDVYIHKGVQDEFYAVRSLAVDCLGHIPATLFGDMPAKRQYGCLALALGMIEDEDPTVRAAACRTLGMYVGFTAVMEDVLFLSDVATTIPRLMSDANVGVRIRASWALGNLSDALAHVSENVQTEGQSISDAGITWETITQIIKAAIVAAKDNDKCRSNGTRALGNIIRVCPPPLLAREATRLMKDVIAVILRNVETGTVKTRWNACHALHNILSTPHFPIPALTSSPLYATLTKSLLTCKNYKVRISAAAAFAAPRHKSAYGNLDTVKAIMKACLVARETVDDLSDAKFGEFKYREQLAEQLRTTFMHLYTLIGGIPPPVPPPNLTQQLPEPRVSSSFSSPLPACPPPPSTSEITLPSTNNEDESRIRPAAVPPLLTAKMQNSVDAMDPEIQSLVEKFAVL